MQDVAKMKLVYNLSRSISTCNINLSKYAHREGKFMTKIMRGEQTKRKWYTPTNSNAPNNIMTKKPVEPQNNRRNTVLNKIFMKYITDLMATGEIASDIVGKGIEVTRVSVTSDFHQVNVYWLAPNAEERDVKVEEILTKAEGPLRHELSQLRVMGAVPIIKFVRDKDYMKFIEVDRRLAAADFGPDFVPSDPSLRFKVTPVLKVQLSQEVFENIRKLEDCSDEGELESIEENLPEMRNDILGLDHARIMAKVQSSLDKSKAAFENRFLDVARQLPSHSEQNSQVTECLTAKERNAVFAAFLNQRQLDEKRRNKYNRNKSSSTEDERHALDEEYSREDDEFLDLDIHLKNFRES